ncbi:hypothetical protein J2Y45_000443 [Dyadobacter sp. BE34]|uniref:Uncharacterized protein n=1 Tax=Dyadobacter fermentans TaxID=94254 RepID=A0ABU1QPU7_9BACT|nr:MULTISPECIES: hypothetical protein [Dyadobacter]MDR6803173.1 hypothetical protein [Dyadobacter fermentans]MDR7040914.1 hypothetical protein [Dyadobacter sp. BE242]MDR7195317.1 hypothetical protein [Dyadobacter sp. BE34]MDR7214137.1 hypothetical protein [Dyadobacter sp. BE31]MDR7260724.1 hypothetical protein [Dyadobacter sp. BE32]
MKRLINQLELAYAPLTAYEFAVMKDDPQFEEALDRASLYILAQRPVMTFDNVRFDRDGLLFDISQKNNPETLHCKLPFTQSAIHLANSQNIGLAPHFLDPGKQTYFMPFNELRGFSLTNRSDLREQFVAWFSPEKFLWNWWNEHLNCSFAGNLELFTRYRVHYVGKATKQNIVKRITGHSTLQDILSLETPVTEKQLPANEITLLAFQFADNVQFQSFGADPQIDQMVAAFKGEDLPSQERIFLDVEKALIKALKPKYNRALFNSYPISKDGLYRNNYQFISYSFYDPITLIYKDGEITGNSDPIDCDRILIFDNKAIELIKYQ